MAAVLLLAPTARAQRLPLQVFVRLAEPIGADERGDRYEDPLDHALREHGLGEVIGGGTFYAPDGRVLWAGIRVELAGEEALDFLRAQLRALGAPAGSAIEYEAGGRKVTQPLHATR